MSDAMIRTRCACGWTSEGPPDDVVAATIDHGRQLHNMAATPEQVLAAAERLDGTVGSPMEAVETGQP